MGWFGALLVLHVVGGSVALLSGPVSMLSRKGSRPHRRGGRIFAMSLWLACGSAFVLSLMMQNRLLLTISVLTAFLLGLGDRALVLRRGGRAHMVDGAGCLALGGFGLRLIWHSLRPLDVTGLFFGLGSLVLAVRTARQLRDQHTDWLLTHIAGMGGAYVATATAFLVVNNHLLPPAVVFIVPSVAGTVLIGWSSARHAAPRMATRS